MNIPTKLSDVNGTPVNVKQKNVVMLIAHTEINRNREIISLKLTEEDDDAVPAEDAQGDAAQTEGRLRRGADVRPRPMQLREHRADQRERERGDDQRYIPGDGSRCEQQNMTSY